MVFPASIESGSVSDTENAGKMLGEYLLPPGKTMPSLRCTATSEPEKPHLSEGLRRY